MLKPEARTNITNFSLATSHPHLSEGRVLRDENCYRVMDTVWHRITCFNGLGKGSGQNMGVVVDDLA